MAKLYKKRIFVNYKENFHTGKKNNSMKIIKMIIITPLIGIINSLFGSGGGLIAVPLMRSFGCNQKKAQANALAVTVPLSLISMFVYWHNGYFSFSQALIYIPFGFAGALLGTKLLKIMPDNILIKIFSVFILWAGIRTLI